MADSFLCARIAVVEAQILAYDTAIAALAGGVQSYQLDTGQTVQRVTRTDIARLQAVVDGLLNQRDILRQRCGMDTGAHTAAPGY